MRNLVVVFVIFLSSCAFGDDTPVVGDVGAESNATSDCMGVCPHVAEMATEDAARCVSLCAAHPDLTNEDQMTYLMLDAFSK